MLVHGRVIRSDETLELTVVSPGDAQGTRYSLTEKVYLPKDFTEDLGGVLAAEIAASVNEHLNPGSYVADILEPITLALVPLNAAFAGKFSCRHSGEYSHVVRQCASGSRRTRRRDRAPGRGRRDLSARPSRNGPASGSRSIGR